MLISYIISMMSKCFFLTTTGILLSSSNYRTIMLFTPRPPNSVCASLLGAFMEQQIRIPLINDSLKETAAVLSDAAPVTVGVWALFSQNLRCLQEMLSASNHKNKVHNPIMLTSTGSARSVYPEGTRSHNEGRVLTHACYLLLSLAPVGLTRGRQVNAL